MHTFCSTGYGHYCLSRAINKISRQRTQIIANPKVWLIAHRIKVMTPEFLPIYCSSILTVGSLALFARSNKKNGWQKQRGKAANWLRNYYRDGHEEDTRLEPAIEVREQEIPAWTPVSASEAISFSAQLIKMRTALGSAGNAPSVETEQIDHEFAHKPVR